MALGCGACASLGKRPYFSPGPLEEPRQVATGGMSGSGAITALLTAYRHLHVTVVLEDPIWRLRGGVKESSLHSLHHCDAIVRQIQKLPGVFLVIHRSRLRGPLLGRPCHGLDRTHDILVGIEGVKERKAHPVSRRDEPPRDTVLDRSVSLWPWLSSRLYKEVQVVV